MNILFLEDHIVLLSALTEQIQRQFPEARITSVSTAEKAMDSLSIRLYDIFITDLNIKQKADQGHVAQGLDAIRFCKKQQPRTKIIVLTGIQGSMAIQSTLNEGVHGFLFKDSTFDWKKVIDRVLAGKKHIDPDVLALVEREEKTIVEISKSDNDILVPLIHGMSPKEIASMLDINERQVYYRIQKLLSLTKTKRQVELIMFAQENTIVVKKRS